MTAPNLREQRRRCDNVRDVVRKRQRLGKGDVRINRRLLYELGADVRETMAHVSARYAYWQKETSSDREAARLVQRELYISALAADSEGVELPVVLARWHA